jgi:hypothetical protein
MPWQLLRSAGVVSCARLTRQILMVLLPSDCIRKELAADSGSDFATSARQVRPLPDSQIVAEEPSSYYRLLTHAPEYPGVDGDRTGFAGATAFTALGKLVLATSG